ncbi:TetR/AcrR family transcriptional regulator [[Actinomadura] parvosata]|uniref:TetR/AcrR family transcriptional regulator n=1 Tax=[Actinomadura] parvosata TaxID=1955412 RepID=UPI00406C07F3
MTTPTPKRTDALENRQAILDVALQALTESPDVSLNAIAKRAGLANGTLYRHFPTREALVLAVYQCDIEEMKNAATQLLAEHPPVRALREWLRALAHCAMTKNGLADAMRLATGADKSLFPETYQAMKAAIAELLAANEASRTVRAGLDPELVLLALCGIWQLDAGSDWRKQADDLIDLFMTGFGVPAGSQG